VEREVQDRNGHWFSLRIRPYKSLDNRIEGAVVALLDLESARRHGHPIDHTRHSLAPLIEALGVPVMILDADLRVRMANAAASRLFHATRHDLVGAAIADLDGLAGAGEALRNVLRARLAAGEGSVSDFHVDIGGPGGSLRRMAVNARHVQLDNARDSIVLALQDVGNETAVDGKT
jgi:two-component system CheB/CheR fusion protein